ncbi:GTP:adenosylcobinamide-phosphate guanylyltransferase [Methanonatronarchaeum thermophilum]|uniref:GTP:adenosylcobinamide-phosphate guanylyltransferase n=1 Tax=Methanonatronarchaeum thermophilum TaxID=1927129 RepID=A0A1Y3GA98_9EURY|nr:NTP transferase domain-containing protein [Methanonatronarchaeum thermophilum]OUJ18187.1 GTP:adenosylcobinamide-phosphate guanylyltransferase [Methanonatronarchaeum thermophilum]
MKGVVLAGGKGSRFTARKEKQLSRIGNQRLLDIIYDKLDRSELTDVYVAVSENSPETWKYCRKKDIKMIRTRGAGYIKDLQDITRLLKPPFLTTASDIPFIKPNHINNLIKMAEKNDFDGGYTVVIPKKLFPEKVDRDDTFNYMGVEVAPIGLNIVGKTDKEKKIFTYNPKLSININKTEDLTYARKVAKKTLVANKNKK